MDIHCELACGATWPRRATLTDTVCPCATYSAVCLTTRMCRKTRGEIMMIMNTQLVLVALRTPDRRSSA